VFLVDLPSLFDLRRNFYYLGWWPMIAPVKAGEIREETLLGVSQLYKHKEINRNILFFLKG
jgi:hypothetical protein